MTAAAAPTRQAVILVGGEGRRLGTITASRPKPLVEVGGVPFLDHLLLRCRANGVSRVLLLSGYLSGQIDAYAEDAAARHPDLTVEVSTEPEPLGTAGALRHAGDRLDPTFFLMNGDSVFDIGWSALTAEARDDTLAVLALRPIPEAGRYGSVTLDGTRIVSFSQDHGRSGPALMNAGLYWMRRDIVAEIGAGPSSLEHAVFPALAGGGRLLGHVADGHFIDIGIKSDLARADRLVPDWNDALAR